MSFFFFFFDNLNQVCFHFSQPNYSCICPFCPHLNYHSSICWFSYLRFPTSSTHFKLCCLSPVLFHMNFISVVLSSKFILKYSWLFIKFLKSRMCPDSDFFTFFQTHTHQLLCSTVCIHSFPSHFLHMVYKDFLNISPKL